MHNKNLILQTLDLIIKTINFTGHKPFILVTFMMVKLY